jgi:hypothetical protein
VQISNLYFYCWNQNIYNGSLFVFCYYFLRCSWSKVHGERKCRQTHNTYFAQCRAPRARGAPYWYIMKCARSLELDNRNNEGINARRQTCAHSTRVLLIKHNTLAHDTMLHRYYVSLAGGELSNGAAPGRWADVMMMMRCNTKHILPILFCALFAPYAPIAAGRKLYFLTLAFPS